MWVGNPPRSFGEREGAIRPWWGGWGRMGFLREVKSPETGTPSTAALACAANKVDGLWDPRALLWSRGGRYGVVDGPWIQHDPSRSVEEHRGLVCADGGASGSILGRRALFGSGEGWDG